MTNKKNTLMSLCLLGLLSACNSDSPEVKQASITASKTKASIGIANAALYQTFQNPDSKYRPFVRWWWNGARVNTNEAVRQLDVLKDAGFGGVEINTIAMPFDATKESLKHAPELIWLEDNWLHTVSDVAKAAKKRDLTADIIIGSGWPFGGEFLTVDDQIQRASVSKKTFDATGAMTFLLSELAQTNSDGNAHEAEHDIKPVKSDYLFLRLVSEDKFSQSFTFGDDLLSNVVDGKINVDLPKGQYTLYLGKVDIGYSQVKMGAPGAQGAILDHFNKAAVEKYLNHMSSQFKDKLDVDLGELFRATFVDSLELAQSNWTHDFAEQFEIRRGYALTPYLPFILDLSRQDETSQRARYDYSNTLIELFDERFSQTYAAWAKENGVGSRIQAYGRETHPLHGSMRPSHPEGETWLWIDERTRPLAEGEQAKWIDEKTRPRIGVDSTVVNKYVSSGAHLVGKRTISYEAMTNAQPVFRETLGDFKRAFDATAQSGLNHPIIHGFNYTPLDAGFPGWVRYGNYLNERTPFWAQMKNFNDYAARLGSVLRNSDYQAQIAVLAPRPDEWQQHGLLYQPFPSKMVPWYQYRLVDTLQKLGFGVDFVSEEIIEKSTIEKGELVYNGRHYPALILEDVNSISAQAAEKLALMAKQQGKLAFIGGVPTKTSELGNDWQQQSQQISNILSKVLTSTSQVFLSPIQPDYYPDPTVYLRRGLPFDDSELISYLTKLTHTLNIRSPLTITTPSPWISLVHHQTDTQQNVIFISNSSSEQLANIEIKLNDVAGFADTAELWDPRTGKRSQIAVINNTLTLDFDAYGSKLIVFSDNAQLKFATQYSGERAEIDLSNDWTLTFNSAGSNASFTLVDRALTDLSLDDDARVAEFGGTVTYRKTITLSDAKQEVIFDFGFINGTSSLFIDGVPVGDNWFGNHKYKIGSSLSAGEHSIELKVTTVLANFMKAKKEDRTAQKWASWFKPVEAGMMEPASLSFKN